MGPGIEYLEACASAGVWELLQVLVHCLSSRCEYILIQLD